MSATEIPTPRLKERYHDEIRPRLQERFEHHSNMAVPRITKITLNMGVGEAKTNAKALDDAVEQLRHHHRPAAGDHRAPRTRSPASRSARACPSAAR